MINGTPVVVINFIWKRMEPGRLVVFSLVDQTFI